MQNTFENNNIWYADWAMLNADELKCDGLFVNVHFVVNDDNTLDICPFNFENACSDAEFVHCKH